MVCLRFVTPKNTLYETSKCVTKAFLGRYVTQAYQQLQHTEQHKCCNAMLARGELPAAHRLGPCIRPCLSFSRFDFIFSVLVEQSIHSVMSLRFCTIFFWLLVLCKFKLCLNQSLHEFTFVHVYFLARLRSFSQNLRGPYPQICGRLLYLFSGNASEVPFYKQSSKAFRALKIVDTVSQ